MVIRVRKAPLTLLGSIVSLFIVINISVAQPVTYHYDDLNRLIRIDYGDTVIDYTYDDVGNREVERMGHPPITTANRAGGTYGSSQSVALTCTDPQGPGCGNIYYTIDGSTPTTSSLLYSSAILISSNTTLKYFSRDVSAPPINETIKTQAYVIDTAPPSGTVVIQGGAELTNTPNVALTLTCTDNVACSQVQFSNDNLTYSAAEAYGTPKSWTLQAWDGTKIVYVKFRDSVGNWSNPFSDTIVLNNDPPNPPVKIGGTNYTTLQAAYDAASDGATIKCQAVRFIENLTVNRDITVTLDGGYDSGYTIASGDTLVKGSITTTAGGGTITVQNFILEE